MAGKDLLYTIIRIALVIITIINIVSLVIALIEHLQSKHRSNDAGFWAWVILFIVVSFVGFWGAWREDFWYTLIFAICYAIFFFSGFAFGANWWNTAFPIVTIILAAIFCFLLHSAGRTGSPPCSA